MKNCTKTIFGLLCFIADHVQEIGEKISLASRDNSKFFFQKYHIILTIISKCDPKNLQIGVATYFWFISFPKNIK